MVVSGENVGSIAIKSPYCDKLSNSMELNVATAERWIVPSFVYSRKDEYPFFSIT